MSEAQRIAIAVARASRHGLFRPACLTRSLALQRLLERRGIRASRVCVGVRLEGDRFEAHAWVELGDQILGDKPEHVRGFEGLTELQVRGLP